MTTTSLTYNFQSVQVELLIREAFERIGIAPEMVEPVKLESAKRSINLLLLDWVAKDVNLWTLKGEYRALIQGQRQYFLPNTVNGIIQINLRTSTRKLSGLAQTNADETYANDGGGTVLNAFDGNPLTSCVQTAAGGNISYDYGVNSQTITFLGIQSNVNTLYNLRIDYNLGDPAILDQWRPLLDIGEVSFAAGELKWFDVPTPVTARAYRLQSLGDNPLDVQELYFNNNTLDLCISEVSRYDYNSYPNKYLQGRPCVYYFDRQINPVLNIWPTASSQYNCLYYSYSKVMQDVGLYTQTIEIPARFYPALIWGLSWQLAIKFSPETADMLESKYEQAFTLASRDDSERTDITINGEN